MNIQLVSCTNVCPIPPTTASLNVYKGKTAVLVLILRLVDRQLRQGTTPCKLLLQATKLLVVASKRL